MSISNDSRRQTFQNLLEELQTERRLRDEAAEFGKFLLNKNEALEEQLVKHTSSYDSSHLRELENNHAAHRSSHLLKDIDDLQVSNSQLEEDYQCLLDEHHKLQNLYLAMCQNSKDKVERKETAESYLMDDSPKRTLAARQSVDQSPELDDLRDRVARMASMNDDARDQVLTLTATLAERSKAFEDLQVVNTNLCQQIEVLREKHKIAEHMCMEGAEREEEMRDRLDTEVSRRAARMMRSTQLLTTMLGKIRSRQNTISINGAGTSQNSLPREKALSSELLNSAQSDTDMVEKLEILRDELEAHQEVGLELRKEIERLSDLNEDLTTKVKFEEQKFATDLSIRYEGMEAQVSQWEAKFRQTAAEGAFLRAELLEAQSTFNSFQERAEDMAKEIRHSHEAAVNEEAASLNRENAAQEGENCRLKDQLKSSTHQNSKLQRELMEAAEHSQRAEKNVTELTEELQECSRSMAKKSDTQAGNSSLRAELSASAKESECVVNQLAEELKQEKAKMAEKLEQELKIRTENATLRSELLDATEETKSLKKNEAEKEEALKQDPDQRDHQSLCKLVEAENAKLQSELNDSNHKSLNLQESLAELKEAMKKDNLSAASDGRHLRRFSSDSRQFCRAASDTSNDLKAHSECMKELASENAELRSELQAELQQVTQHSAAMQRTAEELSDKRRSIGKSSAARSSREMLPLATKVSREPNSGSVIISAEAVLEEDPLDIFNLVMSIFGCSRTKPAVDLVQPVPGKGSRTVQLQIEGGLR